MAAVTVSSKCQIVIPREVREQLKTKPGQKLELITIGDRVEMVRVPSVAQLRGVLKGVKLHFDRDADEEERG